MSFRSSTCRISGSRAGPISNTRRRSHGTAPFPKRGGVRRRLNETNMILGDILAESGGAVTDRARETANDMPAVRATLDHLFRRALERRPDALALIDPPDRAAVTDGPVRRLTYAQADRAISALAARLRTFGLPTDSVVAI